ncbi:MAG: DUF2892 domain-containing protein [Rhodospirillales bacterium]
MSANVGTMDRVIRLIAGVALASMPYWVQGPWRWVGLAVGAVLILTALVRFCPAYKLFGLNTCPLKH